VFGAVCWPYALTAAHISPIINVDRLFDKLIEN
jgi:hypothetical protein